MSWRRPPAARPRGDASAAVAAAPGSRLLWAGHPASTGLRTPTRGRSSLEHGFAIWNNFWYAGRYSFVTYSVLYYPLAALIGIRCSPSLSIASRRSRSRWSSGGSGAVRPRSRAARSPSSGRARALGRVPVRARRRVRAARARALQTRPSTALRRAPLLTLLASPLGFALLVLALVGGALARPPRRATDRRDRRRHRARARAPPAVPRQGQFPFSVADLIPGALFGASVSP